MSVRRIKAFSADQCRLNIARITQEAARHKPPQKPASAVCAPAVPVHAPTTQSPPPPAAAGEETR